MFKLATVADRAVLVGAGVSIAAIVIGAQTALLERILQTRDLDFGQWLMCIGAALVLLAATELRVVLRRGR